MTYGQGLPATLRNAGWTVEQVGALQAEMKRTAAAWGASEAALSTVMDRVSDSFAEGGQLDLQQVLDLIDGHARKLAELQHQLALLAKADIPEVADLLTQAQAALAAGDLLLAQQLMDQTAENAFAQAELLVARAEALRISGAEALSVSAAIDSSLGKYLSAATRYADATRKTAQSDTRGRIRYLSGQAVALAMRGRQISDPQTIRKAIALLDENVLPLLSKKEAPRDWAIATNSRGAALSALGQTGTPGALASAVDAHLSALSVLTRETFPEDWADTQILLASALAASARLGVASAGPGAIAALRSALEVRTRERAPDKWATIQMELGGLWLSQPGKRGGDEAEKAFIAAMTVYTKDKQPFRWAAAQSGLCASHTSHASGIVGGNYISSRPEEGYKACLAALEIFTPEATPVEWAAAQNNLGRLLAGIDQRGQSGTVLDRAIETYRSALSIVEKGPPTSLRADIRYNLAASLERRARGNPAALREALALALASRSDFTSVSRTHAAFRDAREPAELGDLITDLEAKMAEQ